MRTIQSKAKKHLLERRHQIIGPCRDFTESNSWNTIVGDWPDLNAYARAAAVLEELSGTELRELREVDAALQRLKNGIYGRCKHCGAAIGRRRLRAIPEARNCLDCQLARESTGPCAAGELRSRVVGGVPPPPAISPARPPFEFPIE